MAGVYCGRCLCQVILDSDHESCSNCGTVLIGPRAGKPANRPAHAPPGPPAGYVPRHRKDRQTIGPPPAAVEPSDAIKESAMTAAPPTAPPRPPARKRPARARKKAA